MRQFGMILCLALVWLQPLLLAAQEQEQEPPEAAGEGRPGAPAPAERVTVSLGLGAEALAEAYPDQARWLDTEADAQVLVMFEKEQTASPRGAVLILADEGQGANTGLAGALRQPLTRAGWAAMAMGLPELPLPLARARRLQAIAPGQGGDKEAGKQGEEPSADDTAPTDPSVMIDVMAGDNLESLAQRYDSQVLAGLDAGLAELQDQGYERLVLVAVGHGAELAAKKALAGDRGVQALVWIAPTFAADAERTLAARLEASPLRVLDLVSSRREDDRAAERAALMRRQGVADYSQQPVAMASRPERHNAHQLANRILAWLGR
ncbi:MAG: DUF3530 family protein [Marinobacter sp.]|uniref:DUF3530 family protein n=1 Tax=Marinobacter sp. TaxID=50741 RepID=UPI00299E3AC5|nr:DUF3530 family protein [Marinobacter sp.]MDX1633568.1 DUF3530 family protein [Marinobacter sp.]